MSAVYKNKRPSLSIECTGGANLGRCYNASYFRITSLNRLTQDQVRALERAGFLGYGQEFMIKSPVDDKLEPAGTDELECVDDKTGQPAINQYSGKPYPPIKSPYWTYDIERRVDSSD